MKQDASAEETLKRWQDEEAAARARIFGRCVATRAQMAGLTGLQQMQLLLDGKAPAPRPLFDSCRRGGDEPHAAARRDF